jgi:hypothetical protein
LKRRFECFDCEMKICSPWFGKRPLRTSATLSAGGRAFGCYRATPELNHSPG